MKSSIFVSSLAAALFLAPVLASAQPQDNPPNRGPRRPADGQMRPGPDGQRGEPGQMMGQMMKRRQTLQAELALTDVQKADLRKLREGVQKDRLRKGTDLKIASMDLRSLLRADKVDEKAVTAKLAEVQAAQGALLKIRVDSVLAAKKILTPEQQKKMAELRATRGGMGQRMKRRGRGGMGAGMGRGRMGQERALKPGGMPDDDLDLELDDESGSAR